VPDPNNILDRRTKTAWLCVPKVANTAVKVALLEWHGIPIPKTDRQLHSHPAFEFVSAEILAGYAHYTRVAFARHPFDRLVSCWSDKCSKQGWWESLPMFGLRTGMTFPEFVDVVCGQDDYEQNIHYRPLSALLTWRNQPVYDVLCRFEHMVEDWGRVRQLTGAPMLKQVNVSKHDHWSKHITPELAQKISYRYAADFVRFGYAGIEYQQRSEAA